MKQLKTIAVKLFSCFTLLLSIQNISIAQSCNGTWSLQRPATEQCVVGQWVGWQVTAEASGCPVNPVYVGTQTNTFTFNNPVGEFSLDFIGFDGYIICARIAISINGEFYPLSTSNLSEFPSGSSCTSGSYSYITVTPDGYIIKSSPGLENGPGKGRITITNINASSVTVSTNDINGTVFSNLFNCITVVPLTLVSFIGHGNCCQATLTWETGIERNLKNIEVQRSDNGVIWKKVGEMMPKGSNSNYFFETNNENNGFFRLQSNDIDGNYQFSKIIQVKSNCNKSSYSITPNPSTGIMNITGLSGNEKILIYDMAGRNVLSFAEPFTNTYNITKLSGGLYVVAILQDKICKAQLKLVKASFN